MMYEIAWVEPQFIRVRWRSEDEARDEVLSEFAVHLAAARMQGFSGTIELNAYEYDGDDGMSLAWCDMTDGEGEVEFHGRMI